MMCVKSLQYRESLKSVIAHLDVHGIYIKSMHFFSSIVVLIPLIFLYKINVKVSLLGNES